MYEVPPHFESNAGYVNWELSRVIARLQLFLKAKEEGAAEVFAEGAAQLVVSRRETMESRRRAVGEGVPIHFEWYCERFGLSPLEEEAMWLCLTAHMSIGGWRLLMYAQGSVLKPWLETGFIAELLDLDDGLLTDTELFEPQSRLVMSGLTSIEAGAEGGIRAEPLSNIIRTPQHVAAFVGGRMMVDSVLAGFCEVTTPGRALFDVVLPPAVRSQVGEIARGFRSRTRTVDFRSRCWTVFISGPAGSGKSALAEGLASTVGRPIFNVSCDRIPDSPDAASLVALAIRNCSLIDAVLVVQRPERLAARSPQAIAELGQALTRFRGLAIVECRETGALPDVFDPLVRFSLVLESPDTKGREQLWESLLVAEVPVASDVNLRHLAAGYELNGRQIKAAVDWAMQRGVARGVEAVTMEDLRVGADTQLRSQLGRHSDASRVKLTLDELILPDEQATQIRDVLDACRHRLQVMQDWGFDRRLVTGKGLVVLFTGPPGTGKTLCAEILAAELGADLHLVSIPQVVSKYVGETEKNLRMAFAAARAQGSVLLFDEADSLFTKRVAVERSQDHFQNMEVNMLLQEVERFEGIVLLTTNLAANLDPAFQRRILFRVDFPEPDVAQRALLWRSLIPVEAPKAEDINYHELALAAELTGGQVKNAIIRAAYRCFGRGGTLSQAALLSAAADQARAAGRLVRTS